MAKDNQNASSTPTITLDEVMRSQAEANELTEKHERFKKDVVAATRRRDTHASLAHTAREVAADLKRRFEQQLVGK